MYADMLGMNINIQDGSKCSVGLYKWNIIMKQTLYRIWYVRLSHVFPTKNKPYPNPWLPKSK